MSENENVMDTSEEVEVTTEVTAEASDVEPTEVTAVEDTENTAEVVPAQPGEQQPSFGKKLAAGVKEWFRKFIVKLKHKPQNIPFAFLLITSFMYLCFLGTTSKFIDGNSNIKSLGLFQFVNTLASILILLIFLNAFPKRKKINIVMLVITFVVLALMIVMDILFIVNVIDYGKNNTLRGLDWFLAREGTTESINTCIVHIVFVGFTALLLALLPVFKMLLMKINTSKELASNDIKEELDTSEEDG